ncbi:pyridoxal phosphate-dependent decarboxylase family protein [Fimbriimonas ginsengisoli]|uniref:pyridoxal phosphate-dependent decarboxylase family protein n=1 Tax=Fimbriimonas ginsengisoli TaxID=1005039 RepID=UPI00056E8BC8|nr:aminotransferase class I/II-fold pyridoxal phosphate-dependent enzyme [Fimbriimonas ginsengisoli]
MSDGALPTDKRQLTLDPENWEEFARLAHRMVDDMVDHLRSLPDQPAWQPMPAGLSDRILDEPLPTRPQGEEEVYEQFLRDVLPYPNGNLHPRFYGWVQGNGTPLGMMADMLASGMNAHLAGFNQAPPSVELKVIDWLRELLGFPEGTSGLLLSGGSMASLTGLAVARNAKAGFDVREEGVQGDKPHLTVYGSSETHSWAKKAVELLGLGNRAFRRVPVKPDFTLDVEALKAAVREDREAGHRPIAVLGTAGTVNTGATDDLDALADLCAAENMWLHVDGAFGALAAISPRLRPLVKGLERADSVAFDLHKWMYLPFEVACLLVRDGEAHRSTFSQNASYISALDRGTIAGGLFLADLGVELTRGFKALKVWMSLKAYGIGRFSGLIEQNVDQAQYLEKLVGVEPSLELTAPAPMNIVCFRYLADGLSDEKLNDLNSELLFRVQESGAAVPSSTVIDGKFCLRVCFVNHRTRFEDVDDLVSVVLRIGGELSAESK